MRRKTNHPSAVHYRKSPRDNPENYSGSKGIQSLRHKFSVLYVGCYLLFIRLQLKFRCGHRFLKFRVCGIQPFFQLTKYPHLVAISNDIPQAVLLKYKDNSTIYFVSDNTGATNGGSTKLKAAHPRGHAIFYTLDDDQTCTSSSFRITQPTRSYFRGI